MQEILIDVCEHARRSLEGVICSFEAGILGACLMCCVT
jgi:hypothetical protein